jgi:hypothetical protein
MDCSRMIEGCEQIVSFCERCLAGVQDSPMELNVTEEQKEQARKEEERAKLREEMNKMEQDAEDFIVGKAAGVGNNGLSAGDMKALEEKMKSMDFMSKLGADAKDIAEEVEDEEAMKAMKEYI